MLFVIRCGINLGGEGFSQKINQLINLSFQSESDESKKGAVNSVFYEVEKLNKIYCQ